MLLATAKSSMSHPYQVASVTDQSENYKVRNIESKNSSTFWRTSKVCEQASVDIKFAPIKVHHVDIINQFSPQVEIKAYNQSDLGGIIDETLLLPRVTFFNYKEVIENQMNTKTKRYDFHDKNYLPDITFTHMRITVYNPQHQDKPIYLGINSLILFRSDDSALKASPALSFLQQQHKEIDQKLNRLVRFDKLEPSASPSKGNTVNLSAEKERKLSLFKFRDPVMGDSQNLHIKNVNSSPSQRRHTIGLENVVPGLKRNWDRSNHEDFNNLSPYNSINGQEKKIRPNYMNRDEQYRSNLGRPMGQRRPNDSSQEDDDELQRALRESEQSYKKEKERWQQFDNEDIGRAATSKKVTGLRKINENDERTQDLDDFQRAIQESKEMYLQDVDQPKLGMMSSMDSQDEVNGKAYIEMLERVAEEEEEEIGEIPEDEKEESEAGEPEEEMDMVINDFLVKAKEDKEEDDDAGTEVLEDSMMKLWSTEDDEVEIKNKNRDEMEIEERKESARGQERGEVDPRIKLTFDLSSQNSQRRNHQLWGRPDTNKMISLMEKDFYNKYLHMETKARNDAERRKGGINRVEVVTSYENIMSDVVFCLAGFEGDEKKSLKDLGISMGARYLDDIYTNLTTHLITNDTMTKRYKRAKKTKDVIIVSTRWLIECYGQKKRLSEKEFIVNIEEEEAFN